MVKSGDCRTCASCKVLKCPDCGGELILCFSPERLIQDISDSVVPRECMSIECDLYEPLED